MLGAKMKLLVNASTLSGTGVTQVAIAFIEECKNIKTNEYIVVINSSIERQLDISSFPCNFEIYTIKNSPRFIFRGYRSRQLLRRVEKKRQPDCVFSIFGPSYWTPNAPHLMGYAYPHYVYPESPVFSIMSILEKTKIYIYKYAHKHFFRRNGNYYVCETKDVSARLAKYLKVSKDKIFTVPNTYNHFFNNPLPANSLILPNRMSDEFRFLCLCSFEKHKNLEILNSLIPILLNRNSLRKITFVLTVDQQLFMTRFSVFARKSIINIGRISAAQCPQLYNECDALFLPTLLECSSANYPEAMKMEKPILTSDLSFARGVCHSAALYFDPRDVNDIADKIEVIIDSQEKREELIKLGSKLLGTINTSSERARAYISICEMIIDKNGIDKEY
jgi:glycosyltransferase involved in cell wall biosynthesis